MNIDLSPLDEVDEMLKIPNFLDPNQEKFLRLMFANNDSIPVRNNLCHIPTIEEVMSNAGKEVLKYQKKGFVTLKDKAETPEDVYKKTIYVQKMKESVGKPRTNKTINLPISSEPFQKFWLSSRIVAKTIHEIRALPYYDKYDRFDIEQKFIDQVSSVTRIMKHDGSLDEQKRTKQQLYDTMEHFVRQTMKIRFNLISSCIQTQKIDFSKLKNEQKKEFQEFEPQQEQSEITAETQQFATTKPDELDLKIIERLNETTIKLPSVYKFSEIHDNHLPDNPRKFSKNQRVKSASLSKESSASFSFSSSVDQNLNLEEDPASIIDKIIFGSNEKSEVNSLFHSQSTTPAIKTPVLTPTSRCMQNFLNQNRTMIISNPLQNIKKAQNNKSETNQKAERLSHKEIYGHFWKENDPLDVARSGNYINQLNQLESYTADVELDGQLFDTDYIEMPFPLECEKDLPPQPINKEPKVYKKVVPSKYFFDNLNRISLHKPLDDLPELETVEVEEIKENEVQPHIEEVANQTTNEKNPENEDKLESMFSTSVPKTIEDRMDGNKFGFNLNVGNRNDIMFLMEQSAEIEAEQGGVEIHQRLEQIWERLGFSVMQKLDMVVKYSQDTEISSKLNEALSLWEQALSVTEMYEKCYGGLKDFLKLEAQSSNYVSTTVAAMKAEIEKAIESLKQVATRLRQSFNDELIIHRKQIAQLVTDHRIKIQYLCDSYQLNYESL